MKVFAIFGSGANQRALAHRLNKVVPLAHVAEIVPLPSRVNKRDVLRFLISRTLARGLRSAWQRMMAFYDAKYPSWPTDATSTYHSANAAELTELIERERPDLILVSGTDLLKAETIDRFPCKVMNLHTGISPYIKGAPNCTNWALALGEYDLIGNTIMWIDAGIDSGRIITTERTPLAGDETLAEIHKKVMEHAHDLYIRAVLTFIKAPDKTPGVAQKSLGQGRLFLNRHWTASSMIKAYFNYKRGFGTVELRPDVKLVSLT